MSACQATETTQLLRSWAGGEPSALNRLTPHVYQELRRIAGRYMQNESPARTIQATGLVHEAYLRLAEVTNVDWQHRGQFFAITGAHHAKHTARQRTRAGLGEAGRATGARESR